MEGGEHHRLQFPPVEHSAFPATNGSGVLVGHPALRMSIEHSTAICKVFYVGALDFRHAAGNRAWVKVSGEAAPWV